MKGTNPITKVRERTDYSVTEIFGTLQGEGPSAGRVAVFVRFQGCNLACRFCDTNFDTGVTLTHRQFVNSIQACWVRTCDVPSGIRRPLVVFTGGEPMLQLRPELVLELLPWADCEIETAGTVYPRALSPLARIICSPKTPVVDRHVAFQAYAWKYIIAAGQTAGDDGLPNMSTQREDQFARLHRPPPGAIVFVQPMATDDPGTNAANQAEAVRVALKYNYRLSLQTHKIVGLP